MRVRRSGFEATSAPDNIVASQGYFVSLLVEGFLPFPLAYVFFVVRTIVCRWMVRVARWIDTGISL